MTEVRERLGGTGVVEELLIKCCLYLQEADGVQHYQKETHWFKQAVSCPCLTNKEAI